MHLDQGRIVGGNPDAPSFRELVLARVEREAWTMVDLRAQGDPSIPQSLWTRPRDRDDGWLTGFDDPPPDGVMYAAGKGSQYIITVPALRLVIVATGGNDFTEDQSSIFGVLRRHLLAGVGEPRSD